MLEPHPREILQAVRQETCLEYESGLECLSNLYFYRNMLVHEINNSDIGYPVSHNHWTCEIAIAYGRFIHSLMQAIELIITQKGAGDFPNKLLPDGSALGMDEQLKREILTLENDLKGHIAGFDAVLETSRAAVAEEEKILLSCGPHLRWIDVKAPARRALHWGRLQYLRALKNLLSQ